MIMGPASQHPPSEDRAFKKLVATRGESSHIRTARWIIGDRHKLGLEFLLVKRRSLTEMIAEMIAVALAGALPLFPPDPTIHPVSYSA
jgi:hypothetical protein